MQMTRMTKTSGRKSATIENADRITRADAEAEVMKHYGETPESLYGYTSRRYRADDDTEVIVVDLYTD